MAELLALADSDAQQRWDTLRLAYTETQGLPALREAAAAVHYSSIQPDQLVVAAPQELVLLTMQALLAPGDRVVCTVPGYQSLYEVAASLGCQLDPWPLCSAPDGSLAFRLENAEALIGGANPPKLVVVNSPHNPSGFQFSQEEWQRLVELCKGAGAYLFSDEMYRWLELDPSARLPAAADAYERGISLTGCSKATGGPGLRIGWVATRDATLLGRILELKDYTTICNSAPSEILALIMLRNWDALVQQRLATIRRNLDTLDAFFARWAHVFAWRRPAAGTVAFPRLTTGEPIESWCGQLVEETGVLLMPATVYGQPECAAEGRFRLGFGRSNMPEVLGHLEAWLAKRYPAEQAAAAGS
ncbi:classes I and II [Chlorella sorokiniana]|uniref:Classes I and II n=1 Tax=Chlorella sorokiniana TaxID=3076 RepID=A0A2P6TVJ4_CHLSO|nr:classes I and II [Chlorella sorokiniana]|eukprot:PRW58077.1 classes I and II [Chlorella sorokiniana]